MFNVKGDLKPLIKHMSKVQKRQIPFAAANAKGRESSDA